MVIEFKVNYYIYMVSRLTGSLTLIVTEKVQLLIDGRVRLEKQCNLLNLLCIPINLS